jgi:hypothetical protein
MIPYQYRDDLLLSVFRGDTVARQLCESEPHQSQSGCSRSTAKMMHAVRTAAQARCKNSSICSESARLIESDANVDWW